MSNVRLSQNNYGKSKVRFAKIVRRKDHHDFVEVSVDSALEGDFETAHTLGDNSNILPTDTQKNTVYALARNHSMSSIESFGVTLAQHFLQTERGVVRSARIELSQTPWARLKIDGTPHPHAFRGGNSERALATVFADSNGLKVSGGLTGLLVMKTTDSGFEGYIRDKFTTLKETNDRIFATVVTAHWPYASADCDFAAEREMIRTALIETFARHKSLSVQQTLYAMAEAALAASSQIEEIRLSLPNKHYLLANLAPFHLDNPNDIFVPTDEPHGLIEATIARA